METLTKSTMNTPNTTSTIRDLEGKVAIVTGAAGGIGLATVRVNAVGAGDVVTNLLNTFREDGREFLA